MRDSQARYWGACALSAQVHTFSLSPAGLQPTGLPFRSPSYLCILFHRDQVTFDMGVMMSALHHPGPCLPSTPPDRLGQLHTLGSCPTAFDSAGDLGLFLLILDRWDHHPTQPDVRIPAGPAAAALPDHLRLASSTGQRPPASGEAALLRLGWRGCPRARQSPVTPRSESLQSSDACWSRSWGWFDPSEVGLV